MIQHPDFLTSQPARSPLCPVAFVLPGVVTECFSLGPFFKSLVEDSCGRGISNKSPRACSSPLSLILSPSPPCPNPTFLCPSIPPSSSQPIIPPSQGSGDEQRGRTARTLILCTLLCHSDLSLPCPAPEIPCTPPALPLEGGSEGCLPETQQRSPLGFWRRREGSAGRASREENAEASESGSSGNEIAPCNNEGGLCCRCA